MNKNYLFKRENSDNIIIRTVNFPFTKEYVSGVLSKEKLNGYDPYEIWGSFSKKTSFDESDEEFSYISHYMRKQDEFTIKKGEKLAFLVNEDWKLHLSCIDCEVEFFKDSSFFVNECVVIILDDDLYFIEGEYHLLDEDEVFDINKGLGTNYKYIIETFS